MVLRYSLAATRITWLPGKSLKPTVGSWPERHLILSTPAGKLLFWVCTGT